MFEFSLWICQGIQHWNGKNFWWIFCSLRFPGNIDIRNKARKSSKHSGKFGAICRAKFGSKISKIQGLFVLHSGCRKRGLSLRGVAFMTVLAVLESTLPSFCFSYRNTAQWDNRGGFDGSVVTAVSIMTATHLKLNPPFSVILHLFHLNSPNIRRGFLQGGGGWARKIGTICPFGVFFSPNFIFFGAQLGGNPCSDASCGVVTFSVGVWHFRWFWGGWNPKSTICPFRARRWPFQAPKTLRFLGKMANFEAKNTIKQGKRTPKGQMAPISRI